jgi:hypothetical protein
MKTSALQSYIGRTLERGIVRAMSTVRNGEDKKITYRTKGLRSTCDRGAAEILANRALNLEKGIIVKVCSLADSPNDSP